MGTGNEMENTSAFMVHHILKKRNISKQKQKHLNTLKQKKLNKIRLKKNQNQKKDQINQQLKNNVEDDSPNELKSVNDTQFDTIIQQTNNSSSSFNTHFKNKTLFQWIIGSIKTDDFINNYWETKPLYISNDKNKFSILLSTVQIDELLINNNIQYTKNIDITFYSDGVKEIHNLEGRVRPHVVWDFYCNKCSLRLLNPQTFVPNIHKLSSELQEYFGCFIGCNAYLTPPNSQGFAPHYDDIEAFILQIEGRKRWKVYKPRIKYEELPRYSSENLNNDNIGEPVLEIILSEGDVLYLPRGYIHQASTENYHSLHITISAYQRNAWIDLLEKIVPIAMEKAWKNDIEFRKGLPLHYLKVAGLGRVKECRKARAKIKNNVKTLINKLTDHVYIDAAIDQLGTRFLYDALPPVLTEDEKMCTVFSGGLKMTANGIVKGLKEFQFQLNTEIALLRRYVSRFVKEKEENPKKKMKIVYRLYYTTDNSLEYHGEETSFLVIPKHFVESIQYLFQNYPNFITISQLPCENTEEKINLIADLWERGIIRTQTPILLPD
ncbi:hypothetical protein PGB90_002108 [Kerria lacca]